MPTISARSRSGCTSSALLGRALRCAGKSRCWPTSPGKTSSPHARLPRKSHALTSPSRDCVQAGPVSGRYQAPEPGSIAHGVGPSGKDLSPEVDLSQHDALGVWIHGDGRGELLNIQLTNPPQYWEAWDEHYVKVDFQGWRTSPCRCGSETRSSMATTAGPTAVTMRCTARPWCARTPAP